MKVKMENGFAKAYVGDGAWLVCCLCCGEFSLCYECSGGNVNYHSFLCESKKRLSTINKKAAEYGVEFVA